MTVLSWLVVYDDYIVLVYIMPPPLSLSLPPSLPPSLSLSLPPSLSPSLPLSLSPSLPLSLSPSLSLSPFFYSYKATNSPSVNTLI